MNNVHFMVFNYNYSKTNAIRRYILTAVLDDLKMIHARDAQDALGIAEKQSQQYLHNFHVAWTPQKPIYEVIVAGMGGSGLAAKAYKVAANLHVPFEVIQGYELPDRIGENTLLICSSYSGNTEETLSVFEQAMDIERPYPRPMIVVIAAGGKLLERAKDENLTYIELPGGFQPRYTFGYQYRALVELFACTPLVDGELAILEATAQWLESNVAQLVPDVPVASNQAKQLAQDIVGSSIVIYSGPILAPAAYKWKINVNENAKNVAWTNTLPEFNHNEFLGWTSQPVEKPYKVIDLRSSFDHERVNKRFEITERLLSGKRPHPYTVQAQGDTVLAQLLWTIQLGDFTSLYLALLNGLNPTPVELIEKLKKSLNQ